MMGLVPNTGSQHPLAEGFQETGSKSPIWPKSLPVCNCASVNASDLDLGDKLVFYASLPVQSNLLFSSAHFLNTRLLFGGGADCPRLFELHLALFTSP